MSHLFRILYCSRNRISGSADAVNSAIRDILTGARRNNASVGVTGGLLFSAGCFAQVLEGPLDPITDIFERIQCDDRHTEVTILGSGPILTRDFSNWSMAYTGTDDSAGSLDTIALDRAFAGQSKAGDELLDMLRALVAREGDWLAPLAR